MFSVILKIINVKVKKRGSCPRYYRPFIFSCEFARKLAVSIIPRQDVDFIESKISKYWSLSPGLDLLQSIIRWLKMVVWFSVEHHGMSSH